MFSSVTQLYHVDCSAPGFPLHHQISELVQTHVQQEDDAIQLSHHCHHLLFLLSISPSIRVYSNQSVLRIRWPDYWSFSISPANEYSGLISFKYDWLDLFAVQWTLKSLLQHHFSKASIVWCSAFFMVQLTHPYTTTGKTLSTVEALWVHLKEACIGSLLFSMLGSALRA